MLNMSIVDFGCEHNWRIRTIRTLEDMGGIKTLNDLTSMSINDIAKIKYLGVKSFQEIMTTLSNERVKIYGL